MEWLRYDGGTVRVEVGALAGRVRQRAMECTCLPMAMRHLFGNVQRLITVGIRRLLKPGADSRQIFRFETKNPGLRQSPEPSLTVGLLNRPRLVQ